MHSGLLKAIRFFGTQKALANMLGVKQQAISNWLNREIEIPYLKVIRIVSLTKGHVTHKELAPYRPALNDAIDDLVKIFNKNVQLVAPTDLDLQSIAIDNVREPESQKTITKKIKGRILMREYAKISPRFWSEIVCKEMKKLGPDIIVISLYLQTSKHSNMIGVYHLPIPYICFDTGICEEKVIQSLEYLQSVAFSVYDFETGYVWVVNMAFEQIAEQLDIRDKRVKSINTQFQSLPNLPFLRDFYLQYKDHFHINETSSVNCGFDQDTSSSITTRTIETDNASTLKTQEAPCKALQSQEQKKEQEQELSILSSSLDPSESDIISNSINQSKGKLQSQIDLDTIQVLEFLNLKTKRNYRFVDANLRLIKSRLISGVTLSQCRQVIAKKIRDWQGDSRMSKYLRPATLFNHINFEQYLGELFTVEEEEIL